MYSVENNTDTATWALCTVSEYGVLQTEQSRLSSREYYTTVRTDAYYVIP
jgi:hypothetical protein